MSNKTDESIHSILTNLYQMSIYVPLNKKNSNKNILIIRRIRKMG